MAWESSESFEKTCNFERKDTGADRMRPDFYYVYLRWDRLTSFETHVWTNIFDIRLTHLNGYRSWELARFGKLRNFLPKIFATASPASSRPGNGETTRYECIILECGNAGYISRFIVTRFYITLSFQILPQLSFKYRGRKKNSYRIIRMINNIYFIAMRYF